MAMTPGQMLRRNSWNVHGYLLRMLEVVSQDVPGCQHCLKKSSRFMTCTWCLVWAQVSAAKAGHMAGIRLRDQLATNGSSRLWHSCASLSRHVLYMPLSFTAGGELVFLWFSQREDSEGLPKICCYNFLINITHSELFIEPLLRAKYGALCCQGLYKAILGWKAYVHSALFWKNIADLVIAGNEYAWFKGRQ